MRDHHDDDRQFSNGTLQPIPQGTVLSRNVSEYKDPVDRLIHARVKLMQREPRLGEVLCSYIFQEDMLDRVATLRRQNEAILFNARWVRKTQFDDVVSMLRGVGVRATAQPD